MRYTESERLAIGEQVYKHELTQMEAAAKYNIARSNVERCVDAYRKLNGLPVQKTKRKDSTSDIQIVQTKQSSATEMEEYMAMSKEELIKELILAKANELRSKKGYEVKGVGANKEFIPLNNKNSKS